jgi:pimeloyl-ACP methyl ester carboxylesterase
MPTFTHGGHRLAYTSYGEGPRTCVLVHGLLLSQKMHLPLAKSLARRGHRVLTIDLLGHGQSDRPHDMTQYGTWMFADQIVALLDHLELDEACVLGTSLGANATLEMAARAPDRLRGMVIEMPVLDNALLACAIAFTPLMVMLTFGEPVMKLVQAGARLVPTRRGPLFLDVALDWVRQDPGPSAAVMHGLFFNRVAPTKAERKTLDVPALVIGHPRDPIHPFSDSGALIEELPDGRLLEANSIIELRFSPERLTNEIAAFLDECWKPKRRARGASRRGAVA